MAVLGIFTVKRVCHWQGDYYTYGGFGEYLEAIRSYFHKTVLFARVFESEPPAGFYRIPPAGLEIVHLPAPSNEASNLITLPLVLTRSWKYMKGLDVIHARMPDYTGIIGALLGRIHGIPVFCQVIADWNIEAQKTPVRKKYFLGLLLKLDYYFYDFLERLTCRGKLVFAQGESCFNKHKRSSDCHLVLSTSHSATDVVIPLDRFRGKTYRILTVARLTGVKNLQLLIRALAALAEVRNESNWRLDIVGSGPRREELAALAVTLGVRSQTVFHGQVARGEMLWDFYDRADVFVLPSRSEGTPKVLLEAMARGVPVIASNVGGIPTTVGNNERGLLFGDNDLGDLVSKLQKLAADDRLRYQLVTAASEFSRLHSLEESTRQMIEYVQAAWSDIEIEGA